MTRYNNNPTNEPDPTDPTYQPHPRVHLEPMTPERGIELYLDTIEESHAQDTIDSHASRLSYFQAWCAGEQIDNLNDLSGRDVLEFRNWKRNNPDKDNIDVMQPASLKGYIATLSVFLSKMANLDAVHPKLPHQIDPVTLSKSDEARDVALRADRARVVLNHLRKFEYGTLPHVATEVMWHTGMRRGAVRSIDLNDYHSSDAYVELHHRPETDTPLKNGTDSERPVALSENICNLLDDWKGNTRPEVKDDYGREPLLATSHGRVARSTLTNYIYSVTRPCTYTGECPHDRAPSECNAAIRKNDASQCPSSLSPHAIRRGAITHWLEQDWLVEHVSGRADVSPDILKKHYDARTDFEKMEQRRANLDRI